MSYTYSEIKTQYGAIEKRWTGFWSRNHRYWKLWNSQRQKGFFFIGCGSSYEISVSGTIYGQPWRTTCVCARRGRSDAAFGGLQKVIGDSLVVVVTRSDETHEILNAVKILRESYGRKVLSVIAREDSALQKMSDMSVLIPWAYDESVCQTRTVSNLYITSVLICAALTGNEQIFSGVRSSRRKAIPILGK